jgi:hypothetical protein
MIGKLRQFAAISVRERSSQAGECPPRATSDGSHPTSLMLFCWFFFPVFFWACCCKYPYCTYLPYSLCNGYKTGIGVLRTPLAPLMTTFWWCIFLASVRRNLWPASSEHCYRVLSFLGLFPCICYSFYVHWVAQPNFNVMCSWYL